MEIKKNKTRPRMRKSLFRIKQKSWGINPPKEHSIPKKPKHVRTVRREYTIMASEKAVLGMGIVKRPSVHMTLVGDINHNLCNVLLPENTPELEYNTAQEFLSMNRGANIYLL